MRKKLITIGLTGGYGAGKSFVSGICRDRGCEVIDADEIAHDVIIPGTAAYRRIAAHFGPEILREDRAIDRAKLARMVFGHKHELKFLNAVVHPAVIREIKKRLAARRRSGNGGTAVVSAPLLIEAGLSDICDVVIVLKVNKEVQVARCQKSKHETIKEIKKRIAAQMPLSEKLRFADYVVDNNGSPRQTEKQVRTILHTIQNKQTKHS